MNLEDLGYHRQMVGWRVYFVLLLTLASCTKANPAASCVNGACTDPTYPFCDVDGSIAGEPNQCIAVSCSPGQFSECRGDFAVTCNSDGTNYDVSACPDGCGAASGGCNSCVPGTVRCGAGVVEDCGTDGRWTTQETCQLDCVDAPAPHCAYLQPKYVPNICDLAATSASLNISTSGTFDTDLDSNCNGGIVTQTGAPDICVVHYGAISIAAGSTLTVIASANQTAPGT